MFTTGQTVVISHFETIGEGDTAHRVHVGSEHAEVIGIVARHGAPGMVNVRPFHGDDVIAVHIKDMVAA